MEESGNTPDRPWQHERDTPDEALRPPPPRVAVVPGARYDDAPPIGSFASIPAFDDAVKPLPIDGDPVDRAAPPVLTSPSRDESVERWALAVARGMSTAFRGGREGWRRFANWTIRLAARIDVPARIAALHLDKKARIAAEKAAEASRIAADRTAEASRIAAGKTAKVSRIAALHVAEGSKVAAERLGEASKIAAAKTAELSKSAGENIAEGVARLDLPDKLAGAGEAIRKGTGHLAEATLQGAETVLDKTRMGASELGATVGRAGAELAEKAAAPILDRGKPQLADAQKIPSELDRLLADEAAAKTDTGKRGSKAAPSLPLFADLPETDEP